MIQKKKKLEGNNSIHEVAGDMQITHGLAHSQSAAVLKNLCHVDTKTTHSQSDRMR